MVEIRSLECCCYMVVLFHKDVLYVYSAVMISRNNILVTYYYWNPTAQIVIFLSK